MRLAKPLAITGSPLITDYITEHCISYIAYLNNIDSITDDIPEREHFKTWDEELEEREALNRLRSENTEPEHYDNYYQDRQDDFDDFQDKNYDLDQESSDWPAFPDKADSASDQRYLETLHHLFSLLREGREKISEKIDQQFSERQPDHNSYEFFPYKEERDEVFKYCKAIAEYIKTEKIPNLIIIDRSSRPLYVGVKEYWKQKYPNERGPNIYFMNPLGFNTSEETSPAETIDLKLKSVMNGEKDVVTEKIRSKTAVLDEFKKTYTRLMKDKSKPALIFDTCLHTGNTLFPVIETLKELGFSDARVGSVNPSDVGSKVETDFYITRQRPEKGCYPFDRDRLIEKTLDHIYSKRTDEPIKKFAARKLREEIKKIVQEHLKT